MTDPAPREEWTPRPLDVHNAVAALHARICEGKRTAATLMASAHEEGRLFLLIDALMWLLYRHIGLDNDPNKLAKLEADLLGLAALTAEYDTEEPTRERNTTMTTATRKNTDEPDAVDPYAAAAQTPAAEDASTTSPAPRSLDWWKARARQHEATIDTLTAERDALQARLDTVQQGEVESLVSAKLHDPADFWRYGPPLAELLDEEGNVDTAKVADALTAIVAEHPHIAQGFGVSPAAPSGLVTARGVPDVEPAPTFNDLLKSAGRSRR